MPKKRESDRDSNSAKRVNSRRQRPTKQNKQCLNQSDTSADALVKKEDDLTEQYPALSVECDEEIICDGEVDIMMSDEGDCVEVEAAEEVYTHSMASTPTPTKSLTSSRKSDSGEKGKSSSNRNRMDFKALASVASTSGGANAVAAKKRKGRRDSGTSSDEERWLTAIESGKLEYVDDELKKIKDPKLMTARQRAMYERGTDKESSPGGELLMSLPTGYREKEKPQTAEDIQKAALKSQKRKQMADEKREKDKKKTMERLLKKQESKQRSTARSKLTRTSQPMISYRNTIDGATISLPPDYEFPIHAQRAREPPKPQLCGIAGCGQKKIYSCSKTKVPLCSYACYRKNVQAIKQIMC